MILLLTLLFPLATLASPDIPTDYRQHPMWLVCLTEPALRKPWYESVKPHFPTADKYLAKLIEVTQRVSQKREHHTLHELVAIAHKELHAELFPEGQVASRDFMGAVVWKVSAGQQQLSRMAWCVVAQDANNANPAYYRQDVLPPANKVIELLEHFLPNCVPSYACRATNWFCFNGASSETDQKSAAQYEERQTQVVSAVSAHFPVEIARFIAKYAIPYGLSVTDALALEGIEPPTNNLAGLNLMSLEGLSSAPRDPDDKGFSAVGNLLTDLDPAELAALGNATTLVLDRNNIGGIRAGTFSNLRLEGLYIRYNYIRTIEPNAFPQSLTRLDLSNNQLRDLPEKSLGHLPALITLILSHNHLTELNGSLAGLDSLQYLYLDHNRLQVPPKLASLPKLENLSINQNRLRHIPPEFARLKFLNAIGNALPKQEVEALRKKWAGNEHCLKLELADDDPNRWYTKEQLDQA